MIYDNSINERIKRLRISKGYSQQRMGMISATVIKRITVIAFLEGG